MFKTILLTVFTLFFINDQINNKDYNALPDSAKKQADQMAEKICSCVESNTKDLNKFLDDIKGKEEPADIFPKMMEMKPFMQCHAEYEKMSYDEDFQAEWKKITGDLDRRENALRLTEMMKSVTEKKCPENSVLYKKFTDVVLGLSKATK